jgi:hypothetical protein
MQKVCIIWAYWNYCFQINAYVSLSKGFTPTAGRGSYKGGLRYRQWTFVCREKRNTIRESEDKSNFLFPKKGRTTHLSLCPTALIGAGKLINGILFERKSYTKDEGYIC